MIVAERKEKDVIDRFDRFGEVMPDGRLTMSSGGKVYRLREAILLSKKLGKPLSQEDKAMKDENPIKYKKKQRRLR